MNRKVKKNYLRRNKYNIIITAVYILLSITLYRIGILNVNTVSTNFHQDLLTVNSIFIGFLFTGLGLMVGFSDKRVIQDLDEAGYMDNYYNSIYFGLFFHMISTILSTLGVVFGGEILPPTLILVEKVSLLGGIIFFIKSIVGVLRIIKYIRNEFNK
ncbi:MAG: hypothetical protein C6W57_03350 [Caldibacillus debilis]|uniref:hypothetical protein n=1 Tax=Caldibacillus debilis TaxID=301148 RepID=UPI000E3A0A5E|nr:hypothetical protein [Caldibacillus debilis]REJ18657.1 MAG: hypothetical protein C6W57_03350 [Caldibacillus debilis]